VRELDFLQVKGKEIPVRIYELLSRKGELEEKMKEVRDYFETGLAHYRRRNGVLPWRPSAGPLPSGPTTVLPGPISAGAKNSWNSRRPTIGTAYTG